MSSLPLPALPRATNIAQDRLPSSDLLAAVMGDIIDALTRELNVRGLGSMNARHRLWNTLTRRLIQVLDLPCGLRRVSVCQDRSVFLVPVCPEALPPLHDLFPTGRAVGLSAHANFNHHSPQFWTGLSASQWRVTIQAWLVQELASWMSPSDAPLAADHVADSFQMALVVVDVIDVHIATLQWLLMDAMGYPRELVRFAYRNHQRELAAAHAGTQTQLIQHWPARAKWHGRALKLFPIAIAMADPDTPPPDLLATRNQLLQHGLSRNAWALLYRFPAPVISLIADDLRLFSQEEDRSIYLGHLSLWCARLGSDLLCGPPTQYDRYLSGLSIYRQHALGPLRYCRGSVLRLVFALLWPVKELTLLKSANAGALNLADQMERRLIIRLHCMVRLELLRHQHELPDLHGRLQWLLLSYSRHLLQSGRSVDRSISTLETMLDWYRHEAMSLPVQAFKRPFPVLLRLSDRWHAQQVERPGETTRDSLLPSSWTSALPRFELNGARFTALLTRIDLEEEGSLMQHCVASYARDCVEQRSHIYAVSFQEERVGTLEMRKLDGRWRVKQFKGLRNHNLMDALTHPESHLHIPFKHFLAAFTSATAGT